MIILKVCIVFAVVITLVAMKKSMSLAVMMGSLATWILFMLSPQEVGVVVFNSVTAWSTLKIIVVMYCITFLQRMLVQKEALEIARKSISSFFNNRWVNCAATPIFIGLLPSPNAAYIAGDMVKASTKGLIDDADQAVTTSFFRHVSEAFLPTYSSIILALSLTGYTASQFVIGMLPMIAFLIFFGCFFLLRGKVPTSTGEEPSKNKKEDFKHILTSLWPIILVIVLSVAFSIEVLYATIGVIILYFILHKFKFKEIVPYFKTALEMKIVLNTFAVMIFKDMLTASGAIDALPDFFSKFPIPTFMVFVLIFLFGTIVSGSLAIIGTCLPIAMVTVPEAGLPLVVLLMSISYAAMQISPTHICLSIVSEYFDIPFSAIVKRTIPLITCFMIVAILYYLVWTGLFI